MASSSTLSIIKKLKNELPKPSTNSPSLQNIVYFLNQTIPFATFAVAPITPQGDIPADQYFSSESFPILSPKSLQDALHEKQTQIDPLSHSLIVPALSGSLVVGLLAAQHKTQNKTDWAPHEKVIIELAAQELAQLLSQELPGLSTQIKSVKPQKSAAHISVPNLVGSSEKLKNILSMIDRIAPTSASVLILGESGTGKELIARRIHALSAQKHAAFVAINCGALSESLLESELFGHEKGSFTGAIQQKRGLVETAHEGTLFLDEIGEMPLPLQAKILRFLQEGVFYRVGSQEEIRVNVRVISATHRNLESDMKSGHFREDLYYRLNTISIHAPALRERKEDIPQLIAHFTRGVQLFNAEALEVLKNYAWPGNIRELENTVERIKILSGGQPVGVNELPHYIKTLNTHPSELSMSAPPSVDMALEDLERIHILRCLNHYEGNKTRAAQSLGITIKTLYNKLHRYGIFDQNGV